MSYTLPEFLAHAIAMEDEHVEALDEWLGRTTRPSQTWEQDPEPVK